MAATLKYPPLKPVFGSQNGLMPGAFPPFNANLQMGPNFMIPPMMGFGG
jgi:hypothetical protein